MNAQEPLKCIGFYLNILVNATMLSTITTTTIFEILSKFLIPYILDPIEISK